MSEITRIETLRIQHWEENVVIASNMLYEAEKRLGELVAQYSGQLKLELDDERT